MRDRTSKAPPRSSYSPPESLAQSSRYSDFVEEDEEKRLRRNINDDIHSQQYAHGSYPYQYDAYVTEGSMNDDKVD